MVRWLRTEGYTAFASFTHLLTLPRVVCVVALWSSLLRPSVGEGVTYAWPLQNPRVVGQDYADYGQVPGNNYTMYDAGIDMTSGSYVQSAYDTPVYATASGTVYKVFRTTDASQTRCDLSSVASLPSNNHGLGNAVIIAHADGRFSGDVPPAVEVG